MAKSRKPKTQPSKDMRKETTRDTVRRAESAQSARNVRETIESIVIAFVLAFLFRTFEAEAFVIPTGSMAPTLRGMHKDAECPECGFWYQASASIEAEDEVQRMRAELRRAEVELGRVEAAPHRAALGLKTAQLRAEVDQLRRLATRRKVTYMTCPMCGHTMSADKEPTYSGDRILVNKFAYDVTEPQRWDVVVFKYPGDAKMNYIKRLVGLPGETVRIYQGDLFITPPGGDPFHIARKNPRLTRATLQDVHDSGYQPRFLVESNWPLRWQVWPASHEQQAGHWLAAVRENGGAGIHQTFSIDGTSPNAHWIRYQHLIPSGEQWQRMRDGPLNPQEVAGIRPQLITDFYTYNTWATLDQGPELTPPKAGLHWVGDLMLECDIVIRQPRGRLLLDLVEGGKHFLCGIDLATGDATLAIQGVDHFAPKATTQVRGPGCYRLGFANVNDQLLFWVNNSVVAFDGPTVYDVDAVFGSREAIRPRSTAEDAGDLAPAGIGAEEAAVEITNLKVLRDTYYIADKSTAGRHAMTDYDLDAPPMVGLSSPTLADFLADPSAWNVFARRRHADFPLTHDQFFVLGDNSPSSKDGRLWSEDTFGHYVERQLLIGRAMFVYWPHSWNRIPGTSIPLPFFPNLADMKMVR